MDNINRELLSFIERSPSAWHAAAEVARELEGAGYTRLYEERDWALAAPGKYYVVRSGSAVVALDLPAQPDGFLIMAAHDDSPAFRVKSSGEEKTLGLYTRLPVERYGGMICSTWLDRPLSVAGRAASADRAKRGGMSTLALKALPSLAERSMWMATLGISSRSRSRSTSFITTPPFSRTAARPATDSGRSSQVLQIMPP